MRTTKHGILTLIAAVLLLMLALAQFAHAVSATGGAVTDIIGYRIHTFTGGGTFTVTVGGSVEVLVVGGGGGGGETIGGGGVASCTAINCTLSFNTGGNGNGYGGGGAYASTLIGCMIVSNRGASYGGGMTYGSADRCTFIGNGSAGTICGVMWGGSARNCLMINNTGGVGPWGWGTLVNCTVVSNVGGFKGDAATNCIVVGNTPYDSSDLTTEGKYYYSCIGTIAAGTNRVLGNNNIYGVSPQFVNITNGNYRLASAQSPCFNAGVNQTWMTNAVDLEGKNRIRNMQVDMGAYELWIKSGTIFRGK